MRIRKQVEPTAKQNLVIGGGAVGASCHVPRLLSLPGNKAVTVVDTCPARRKELYTKFSGESRVQINAEVPDGEFDIAVIATPPSLHLEVFEAVAGRCRRVIIEKPLASNLGDARKLERQARHWGTDVLVSLPRRALGSLSLLRQFWSDGALPRPEQVRISEGNIFNWNAVSLGSFSRNLNGGGVLMDTGPHVLDQLYQLFDELTLQRSGMDVLTRDTRSAIEANCWLELSADEGIPVRVALSRNRILSNMAELVCGGVTVYLGLHDNRIELLGASGQGLRGYPAAGAPMAFSDMFDGYYSEFVAGNRGAEVGLTTALKVQELLSRAYEKATLVLSEF